MPTEKLPEDPSLPWRKAMEPCHDPDHRPPTMMVWEPGHYRHTCPSCGAITEFFVPRRY